MELGRRGEGKNNDGCAQCRSAETASDPFWKALFPALQSDSYGGLLLLLTLKVRVSLTLTNDSYLTLLVLVNLPRFTQLRLSMLAAVEYCLVGSCGKRRGSDEDSDGDGEHASRLVLDSCQFVHGYISIPRYKMTGKKQSRFWA
jgi:hypothetical protein